MTWLGDDGSVFNGAPLEETRPRTHVLTERIEDICEDQALVYQCTTGKQLDGSTALTALQPHSHDGDNGALLNRPLSQGLCGWNSDSLGDLHRMKWPKIKADNITANADRVVYRWLVTIPAGHETVLVHLVATELFYHLSPVVRLYNTSFVQQGATASQQYADPTHSFFVVSDPAPSTTNAYIMSLDITNAVDAGGMTHNIRNVFVTPETWSGVESDALPVGEVAGHSGDIAPSVASVFTPIHDMFTAANRPLSSYLARTLAHNDVVCAELITGIPVPGHGSTTLGHHHDGTLLGGTTADHVLRSSALGWVPESSANGIDNSSGGANEGDFGAAPTIIDNSYTSYYDVANEPVWVPDGVTSIHWGAVVYSGGGGQTTDTRIHSGATINATTNTSSTQTTSGSGWHYISGTCPVTQNALNWIRMETKQRYDKGGSTLVTTTGLAYWAA